MVGMIHPTRLAPGRRIQRVNVGARQWPSDWPAKPPRPPDLTSPDPNHLHMAWVSPRLQPGTSRVPFQARTRSRRGGRPMQTARRHALHESNSTRLVASGGSWWWVTGAASGQLLLPLAVVVVVVVSHPPGPG
jgi:hypothetical protein